MSDDRIRILLFEDNPTDAFLLEQTLAESAPEGYVLEHVTRLRDGLERLARAPVDVALVDLGLPDSQGLDTCRAVIASEGALAVIVLTGFEDEELGLCAVQEGAQDFLIKHEIQGGLVARALRYALERARGEAALKHARDQALEASRLKSAFIANVSHELRTPLNIITGFATLIEERAKRIEDPEMLGLLPPLRRASARLVDSVGGILDLSAIEAGSFRLEARRLDVGDVAARLVEEIRPLAEEKGLDLSLSVRAEDAVVVFDEYCLSRTIANLLENAVKFTPRGAVCVVVDRDAEGTLFVAIEDSGIGMERSFLRHLFEPFVQEDVGASRRFEGNGLGLALAQRFLALNGATIDAESEKGEGTRFRIRFHRPGVAGAPESERAPADLSPTSPIAPAGDPDERAGILVVEDDPDNQQLLRLLLRPRFDVFLASSGDEMRDQLRLHGKRIRLLLMDLSLRGSESGLDLTRALQDDAAWHHVPVIAVTAHGLEEDRRRALAAGCRAFVPKPVRGRDLLALAERMTLS